MYHPIYHENRRVSVEYIQAAFSKGASFIPADIIAVGRGSVCTQETVIRQLVQKLKLCDVIYINLACIATGRNSKVIVCQSDFFLYINQRKHADKHQDDTAAIIAQVIPVKIHAPFLA